MSKTETSKYDDLSDIGAFRSEGGDCEPAAVGWLTLSTGVKISKLPIWDSKSELFARLGFGPASDWLKEQGMRLATVAEMQELHTKSMYISPYTMPTMDQVTEAGVPSTESAINSFRTKHMMSHQWCAIHDQAVFEKLDTAGWDDEPVSNAGKHWVLPMGTIDGWWRADGSKIQNPSQFHKGDPTYCDYATNFHGVIDPDEVEVESDEELVSGQEPVLRKGDAGYWVGVWQQKLIDSGFSLDPYGADKDFGGLTDTRTRDYQAAAGLIVDGIVGPNTWASSVSKEARDTDPSPMAVELVPLTGAERQRVFGYLAYVAAPTRGNPEGIRITNDFVSENIVTVDIPQLAQIQGINGQGKGPSSGRVQVHRLAAEDMKKLWQAWEDEGLLDLVVTWAGMWNPRFIRGSRTVLSNHAFATAFDINAPWNWLGSVPAASGKMGSVRELVPVAKAFGFAWGGDYTRRPDGMHFEYARVP